MGMNGSADGELCVPREVRETLVASQGTYYESLSGTDRHKLAADLLSETKAHRQAALLGRHAQLRGAKLLEVGAGVGLNLIVWTQHYGADVTGVEPDAFGFESSFKLARTLMEANGLDPGRIVNATGEKLPFGDATFDIVFSSNVLEHTERPIDVLDEALRVLRPGGTLQFVFPNFHSYYDGHYGIFHPPIPWPGFFPWYVKWIWRRNPDFARTLRTELNAAWTRRGLRSLAHRHRFSVIGLGEDVFRERVISLDFEAWATLGRVKRALELLGSRRVRALAARLIIALRGWTPLIVTLRKLP
jgi:SAM-dependent methyltransferase